MLKFNKHLKSNDIGMLYAMKVFKQNLLLSVGRVAIIEQLIKDFNYCYFHFRKNTTSSTPLPQ